MLPNLSGLVATATKRQRSEGSEGIEGPQFEGESLQMLSLLQVLNQLEDDVVDQACVARIRSAIHHNTFLASTMRIGSATIPLAVDRAFQAGIKLTFTGRIPEGETASSDDIDFSFVNSVDMFVQGMEYITPECEPANEEAMAGGAVLEGPSPRRIVTYVGSDSTLRWDIRARVTIDLAAHKDDICADYLRQVDEADQDEPLELEVSIFMQNLIGHIVAATVSLTPKKI
jgi:hypothetical protein